MPPIKEGKIGIGRIVGVHGLKGTVKVECLQRQHSLFRNIKTICLKDEESEKVFSLRGMRADRNFLFLDLVGIDDRTAAELLIGQAVFAESEQVADLGQDEWWLKDLIGIEVFKTNGEMVGTVCGAISSAQEILEIKKKDGGDTILIPFVAALVPVVDLERKRIEVVDLPGLID